MVAISIPWLNLSLLDDSVLVDLAKRGQAEAFDELIKRHAPRFHAIASRLVGREEAFDVVQEAFVAAYRSLKHFRGQAEFSTWLHRIVLNACYASLRRVKTALELEENENLQAPRPNPAKAAEQADLRSALERALQKLKPEFRETFVLAEVGELDYAQIAAILGIAVGTVKSRVARAKEILKQILEKEGYRP